jgi:polyisoprenoid-binding protein YceI
MKTFFAFITLLVVCFTPLCAQNSLKAPWPVDPVHSRVQFSALHMGLAEIIGTFDQYEVEYLVEGENFLEGRFNMEINIKSINTGNEQRNGHLLSPDFFDAEKYPTMVFNAKSFSKKKGKNTYKLLGTLTLKGITKEVELDVQMGKPVTGLYGERRFGFVASTVINRQDFGVSFNAKMDNGSDLVSNEVKIIINMEFSKSK